MMALGIGEADDFIFDAGAVSDAGSYNCAAIERGFGQILSDYGVRFGGRVGEIAGQFLKNVPRGTVWWWRQSSFFAALSSFFAAPSGLFTAPSGAFTALSAAFIAPFGAFTAPSGRLPPSVAADPKVSLRTLRLCDSAFKKPMAGASASGGSQPCHWCSTWNNGRGCSPG